MHPILENALKQADKAELFIRESWCTDVVVTAGKVESIDNKKQLEIALRVIKSGKMGTAIATQLDDDTLVERAMISLMNQESEGECFLNDRIIEVDTFDPAVEAMTTEKMVAFLLALDQKVTEKAPDIKSFMSASKELMTITLENTDGFSSCYRKTQWGNGMVFLNEKGFMDVGKSYSSGKYEVITEADIDRLIELYEVGKNTVSLGTEKMPVVFDGSCMGALMLRVLAGVNGGNVVKKISPVMDKINEQIFSPNITIRDDGTLPYGCNSMAFDDEGTRTQNTMLYEKGVLKNFLATSGQAKKLGIEPTGNAIKRTLFSKEIEDAPSLFDTNLIVEGHVVEDKALIGSIKRGLYITGVMGAHTGNINQGEFSMNISSGYLIEDGKFVGKVKGAMVAGNIYDLFKTVEAVGTEKNVMYSIFYPMGYSPMVLFSEASVVG